LAEEEDEPYVPFIGIDAGPNIQGTHVGIAFDSQEELIDLLGSVFKLPKRLGIMPFKVVVARSTGYRVLPIDVDRYPEDRKVLDAIGNALYSYLRLSANTNSIFQCNRVNVLGNKMENILAHELSMNPEFIVEKLPESGYPDIKIARKNLEADVTYLEVKTSVVKEDLGFRYFYYSDGRKIKYSAKHLLINIQVSRHNIPGNYWRFDSYKLSDLSELNIKLNTEFNASKDDIMDKRLQLLSYRVEDGKQMRNY
jgi:hypothetical protein